ncbi:hypothetical protein A6770_01565 [Nostoc minutum NIES-26]|uniref:Uncharacterized protein n=1 Tax=Nostoc minutum NIES-26 TaxID=1844469 RepID=A0A367QY87_9NOSO|nr:hypothetical protein A6770_01565 [Nostoc minutum NIES-26]
MSHRGEVLAILAVKQSGEALAVFSQRGDAGAKAVSVDSKVLLAQRSASLLPRGATDGYAGVSPS